MAEESNIDFNLALIIVGDDISVVKELVGTFVDEPVPARSVEVGLCITRKNVLLEEQNICLAIGTLSSDGERNTITKLKSSSFGSLADGALVVYDTSNIESFESVESWIWQLRTNVRPDIRITLVGISGKDVPGRRVTYKQGKELANSYNVDYTEIEGNTDDGVEELFHTIIKHMIQNESTCSEEMGTANTHESQDVSQAADSTRQRGLFNRILNPIFGVLQGMSKSVPDELGPDPYTLLLYEKALKDGTEKDHSIRVNVVGNFRQGKTSLTKRLLGKKMRDIKSTNGIEIGRYVCKRTQNGKYSYRSIDDKDFDIVGRLVSVALSKENEGKQQDEDRELLHLSLSESLNQVAAPTFQQRKQKLNSGENRNNNHTVINNPDKGAFSNQRNLDKGAFSNESNPEKGAVSIQRNPDKGAFSNQSNPDKGAFNNQSNPDKGAFSNQSNADGNSASLSSATNDGCEKVERSKKVTALSEREISSFTKAIYKKSSKSDSNLETAFDIWDFGGQYIFYATHTIFHSRRAIYLLVFDLSLDLKHVVVDEEFPTESGSRSVEYFLQFWLQSIHSFVGTTDGSQPKVILVGTHRDKIKGSLEQKQRYIKNYFDDIKKLFDGSVLLNHLHPQIFAIDNTDQRDMTIASLREAITKIADDETSVLEVPAKWIHLEKNMKERKHMRILSMRFIMAIDGENEYPLGDLDQVKLFLRYHHIKGTFVYFDEEPISEYVVLDPQYLVDAFKSIITSERFCTSDPELRPVWKKVMTEARLEKCLIERQWGQACNKAKLFLQYKDILLAFLTKHHVIAEATTFDETTNTSSGLGWYIVPSLLREQSNECELHDFLQGKRQTFVTFVMSFENSQIVGTIYHRYIAALIAKWSIVSTNNKPILFTDLCVVRLDANHAGIAKHNLGGIELSVVSLCPSLHVNGTQSDLFRRFSEAVIVHEFGKLRDKKEVVRPYTLEFRCNHVSHLGNGSNNSDSITSLDNTKIVPCPDLLAHDLNSFDAKAEWFGDFGHIDTVPKLRLNDKLISKISHCIGENWQILGHELELTHVQIEHICEDYPNNTLMKIYHLLKKWCHKMSKKATLDVLVQAMRNCPTLSVQWDGIKNIIDGIV